jgi:hypothetical protein
MKEHLGEILTAVVLFIVRYFEKKHICKEKEKEKFEALQRNQQYYQEKINEISTKKF